MYLSPIIILGLLVVFVGLGFLAFRGRRVPSAHLPDNSTDLEFGKIAVACAVDGLVILDVKGRILWVNPAYCTMMGYTKQELIGRNPLSFALPPDERLSDDELADFRINPAELTSTQIEKSKVSLFQYMRKSGDLFWNQISQSIYTCYSGKQYAVLVCRDVTAQIDDEEKLRETSEELAYNANHDQLTGAANRSKLMAFVNDALKTSRLHQTSLGLIQLDLDEFKGINDVHGHAAGDAILQHVTQNIEAVLRPTDILARVGGDEFVVACPDIGSLKELRKVAEGIRLAMRQPLEWQNLVLSCDASIGAAMTESKSDSYADLLRNSDFALYSVKQRGRGAVAVYDARLQRRHSRQSSRANDLRDAIENGRLLHHFQPYAAVETGHIMGFETLARWAHPEDGMIHPRDFLPLAQELGLMADIDFLAFRAANRMRQHLKEAGHLDVGVNINCSGSTLNHPEFRPELRRDLMQRGLQPSDLTLEIREALIFDGKETSNGHRSKIHALHDDGFPILLDDFAAGYTGLTHLNQLPISGFKIERAAIHDILDDPTNSKVTAMILELSHDLGLLAVAEGIETEEQAAQIMALGGRMIQGHLLSPALPADHVLPWLEQRQAMPRLISSTIAPDDAPRYLGANS